MERQRVIVLTDSRYNLDKTLKSVLLSSEADVVIYNKNNFDIPSGPYTIINGDERPLSEVLNSIIKSKPYARTTILNSPVKVTPGWLEELSKYPISIPITHNLDSMHWKALSTFSSRYKMKWSGRILSKYDPHIQAIINKYDGSITTPFVSINGLSVDEDALRTLGGFDGGSALELDLSFKLLSSDSQATVANTHVDTNCSLTTNPADTAYVMEKFLDDDLLATYYSKAKINQAITFKRPFKQLSIRKQLAILAPELFGVSRMVGTAMGKSLAVLCDGPSMDHIPTGIIYRHDVIVGVGDMALHYDCDYVVCDNAKSMSALLTKYSHDRIMMPTYLYGSNGANVSITSELFPGVQQFEFDVPNHLSDMDETPICNCSSLNVAAVHIGLLLNPKECFVYGADLKHVEGKSHTAKVPRFNGGHFIAESEWASSSFRYQNYMLERLAALARQKEIPVIRINHA